MPSLTNKVISFLKLAQENPGWKRLIDSIPWSNTIKFIVDGKPEFYLEVKRGSVELCPGASPKSDSDFYGVSRVYTDAETLNRILEGKRDSVDAQHVDEAIKVLPGGSFNQIVFVHQLFRFGREEILERKRREFEER